MSELNGYRRPWESILCCMSCRITAICIQYTESSRKGQQCFGLSWKSVERFIEHRNDRNVQISEYLQRHLTLILNKFPIFTQLPPSDESGHIHIHSDKAYWTEDSWTFQFEVHIFIIT